MKGKSIIALGLVLLVVVLVIQNHETVKVWFLFWQITGSRAAVLILTFAIGCLTGWLVGIQHQTTRR